MTTGYMWLGEDSSMARRHMVIEHSKDTDAQQVHTQFQADSTTQNLQVITQWEECARGNACLIHNASLRRIEIKLMAKCTVEQNDLRIALDAHPLTVLTKRLANWSEDTPDEVFAPREMKIIELPQLLDVNWYHEVTFKHVFGGKVGSCCIKPNAIFSLVGVHAGVRVSTQGDAGEIRVVNSSITVCTVKIYQSGCNRVFTKAKFDASLQVSESVTFFLEEADRDVFLELDVAIARHNITIDIKGGQTLRVDGVFDPSG